MTASDLNEGGSLPASPSVPSEIEAAFIAGFRASGEGWNGEYPFEGVSDETEDFTPVRKAAQAYAISRATGEA
jgi:hypothetical protein